ncbi:DUF4871 domain-containing protein [Fictibacillus barbaricus]|uniref:DUF4871 domain-containing protein n=1 Tax=Fictibacillus barbaricus TaxID=182136 RepID=A0ABU1U4N0_9BACL|nr:DUF4871 domain-containing protein [Fictibacillus barbaricus]MDR7074356.1 hypothetical protein [Fictibacillus barbaricus]
MKGFLQVLLILFLTACTQEEKWKGWQESPLFKADKSTMIGEKGKIGFLYDDSEAVRFYPRKENKYMWHLWGSKDLPGKTFKVKATSQETGQEITVVESILFGAHNGADAHLPSIMSLPRSGMWKLDGYVDNKRFSTIVVQVHKKK